MISLSEEGEMAYWMKSLNLSEETLRELVATHGASVEAVMTAAGR